jgi:IS30 family transposase
MDTVFGSQGGKCILTLHFVAMHYMYAILLDACTTKCVAAAFAGLRSRLGNGLFASMFPLLLTDRGTEFSDPHSIEFDDEGEGLTRVFYCDPRRSQQKGALEVNHEFIRRVIPKGKSFDRFTQDNVLLMMNHINSYCRSSINDRTPFALMESLYGLDALKKLGAVLIPPDKITLLPSLLKLDNQQ